MPLVTQVQRIHSPWNSPGQNTGGGKLSLLRGIFPTQGSNPHLLYNRRILYQLSYQGSPQLKIILRPKWPVLSRHTLPPFIFTTTSEAVLLVTHVQIRTRITEEVAVQVAPLVNSEARFWAVWAQCPKLSISTLYHLPVASSILPQLLFGFNHRSWVGYMLAAMWIFSGYWWDCNGGHPGTLCSRIQAVAKLHCGINTVGTQYKVLLTWSNKCSGWNYWAVPKQEKPEGGDKNQSVQISCSVVSNSAAPSTAAHQASLSITNSQSFLKLMSIKLVMPSNHLILCRPLLLLPSIFPSIRVFPNESVLHIRWPKYWNVSFHISPSNEYSRLISFRMDWFDLLAVQGTLKSLLQHHSSKASFLQCSAFFIVHLSHSYMTTGTRRTFVGKVISLLFNMLSRLVMAFLPRSKCPLISWL